MNKGKKGKDHLNTYEEGKTEVLKSNDVSSRNERKGTKKINQSVELIEKASVPFFMVGGGEKKEEQEGHILDKVQLRPCHNEC